MYRKIFLLAAATALALATLACGVNINVPSTQLKTGPTVSEDIHVPLLADKQATADVTLKFGAGDFKLQGGSATDLISGTATYNVADFKPVITTQGSQVSMVQGNLKLGGIPYINQDIKNEWDLSLANVPMSLNIEAGAYNGTYDLGGLSIQQLEITDGASNVHLGFSKPNLVELSSFKYTTGASSVSLTGLGNANLSQLELQSGAGDYTLDFSGTLSRNMTVTIQSGVSSVTVIVPKGTAAQLTTTGTAVSVNASGGWTHTGSSYSLTGSGYTITIEAKMGAGSLQLQTTGQ